MYGNRKESAVLIPLIKVDGEWHILYEVRSQLVSQAGDSSFPGGKVEPGETLISIVESHIEKSLPVSIDQLIEDFQTLNPGQAPEKIQIGSTYQFPDYSK